MEPDPRWVRVLVRVLRVLHVQVDTITREEAAHILLGKEVRFIWRPVIHTGDKEG